MTRAIWTIGYEQANQAGLLSALLRAGIGLLVDVRAIAASRRPGFAKRQLAAGLEQAGIGYVHLRALGTPKEGRDAARAGKPDLMRAIFEAHLATAEADHALAGLAEMARGETRLCLLCLEADPHHCHRAIVAERLASLLPLEVQHLRPDPIG